VAEEMLIFRDAICSVAAGVQLTFDRRQVETIVRSIETALLESLANLSAIRQGNLELIPATLRHELRGFLHLQAPLQISRVDLETIALGVALEMTLMATVLLFSDEKFRGHWCMRSLKRRSAVRQPQRHRNNA